MDLVSLLLLLAAGLAGGFLAGLIGIGGGVIFAPVLFFFFSAMAPEVATPLALGTSLLCTLVTAAAGAWAHRGTGRLRPRTAGVVGAAAAVAVLLTTTFVTTQPWYTRQAFQAVFAVILVAMAVRMLRGRRGGGENAPERTPSGAVRAGIGAAAGAVASLAGVGGGIVLVPAYHGLFHFPIKTSTANSLLTIVVISVAGVLAYAARGWSADVPPGALGYVAPLHGLALVLPAVLTARLGVRTAERAPTAMIRRGFAVFALFVAARMAWGAWGG